MKKKRDSEFRGFDFGKLKKVPTLPEPIFYHPNNCKCQKCKKKEA